MASMQQIDQVTLAADTGFSYVTSLFSAVSTELTMFVFAAFMYMLAFRGVKIPTLKSKGKQEKMAQASAKKMALDANGAAEKATRLATSHTNRAPTQQPAKAPKAPKVEQTEATPVEAQASVAAIGGDVTQKAAMIKAHAKEHNLQGAKAVFESFRGSNSMLSNSYLDACVQCGDFKQASAHFSNMKRIGHANVVSYNTMLKAYIKRGLVTEAQELLREMSGRGLQASKVTYHEILNSMVASRDKKSAWRLLDEMREAGVTINSVTCSIMLKFLTDRSNPSEIEKTMGLLDTLEEAVDEVLFSSTVEACIRIKQVHFLSDMIQKYRARGDFVALSAPTYGSMIKAFGQAGKISQILELWAEMESRGVQPTQITLGCMIEALVRCGEVQKAWDLIHNLQQSQQVGHSEETATANTVIYSSILKGFAAAKNIDKVFAVHNEMLQHGVPCNTIAYNTMLDACAKCFAMQRAEQVLRAMKAASVQPDIISYSTVVKGYCLEGDVDKALVVLKEMRADKTMKPDEITYNSFLDGCAKQHRVDEALAALDEMQAAGVNPSNFTLSILVKLLGRVRRLNQAFELVDDLSAKHKFKPNVQVYTCLMQACIQNRKLDRALALHDRMVQADCPPDEKLYTGLARGCLQLHAPQKAAAVVRTAYQLPGTTLAVSTKRGLAPAGVEINTMVEVCASLRGGSKEDQATADSVVADMMKLRGIRIAHQVSMRRPR